MKRMTFPIAVLTAAAGVSLAPLASAVETTIVSDTFTRTGALIGSVADSGQTWGGASTGNANGTQLAVVGSSGGFAYIDGIVFAPESVYRLTVDVSISSGGNEWLGMGFGRPTSSNAVDDTNGFMFRRDNPEVGTRIASSSSTQIEYAVADDVPDQMQVVLTTGATLADSSLTWNLDGVPLRSGEPVDVTGIDRIFLGNVSPFFGSPVSGTYDNLTLTVEPVPEPASLAVVGAGLLLGLRRRR